MKDLADAAISLSPWISPIAFLFIVFLIFLWREERKERMSVQKDFKELDKDVIEAFGHVSDSLKELDGKLDNVLYTRK